VANLHYQQQTLQSQLRDIHQELQVLSEEKQAIQEDNEELRKAMANAKDEVCVHARIC
jgi:regulator of replication initiation timing